MNDFININTTAFTEAVHEATSTLAGDVSTLFDKVRTLETDKGIESTQFDGDALDQRIKDTVCDYAQDIVDNADLSDAINNSVDDRINDIDWSDYITEDIVMDALGLYRYETLITESNISDHISSDYVTQDDFGDLFHQYFDEQDLPTADADLVKVKQAFQTILAIVVQQTQDLANMRTLCGLPNTDTASALVKAHEAVDNL